MRKTNTEWYHLNVESSEYNKKETNRDIENKLEVTSSGRGNIDLEEWEIQTTGYRTGYKDILFNTGNILIANIF